MRHPLKQPLISLFVLMSCHSIEVPAAVRSIDSMDNAGPVSKHDAAVEMYNLAIQSANEGDYGLAKALYRDAIWNDPRIYQAMVNLALILMDEGEFVEAEALLKRALEVEVKDALAWNNLSGLYIAQRKFKKALECIDSGLKWAKDDFLWERKGYILEKLGRFREALQSNEEALKLYPTQRDLLRNATLMAIKSNEPKAAWRHLKEWEKNHPKDEDLPLFRGAVEALRRGEKY